MSQQAPTTGSKHGFCRTPLCSTSYIHMYHYMRLVVGIELSRVGKKKS